MVITNGLVVMNDLHILHARPMKCAAQIKLPSTHTVKLGQILLFRPLTLLSHPE